jgi:hypothetical protein
MARTESEKQVIDKGKLWAEFKNTLFGRELFQFFDDQEKLAKDAAFERLVENEPFLAKQAAQKLSGILAVKSFINDSVTAMNELLRDEKEDRKAARNVPSHV